MFAVELKDAEMEIFDGSLAKHQISQYLPVNKLYHTVLL